MNPLIGKKWKNYEIRWCGLCEDLTITCPVCGNIACGYGNECCFDDFKEFLSLTDEELEKSVV